jgi:hypothetical protein
LEIVRTPVCAILLIYLGMQVKPTLVRKENSEVVSFAALKRLKGPATEI